MNYRSLRGGVVKDVCVELIVYLSNENMDHIDVAVKHVDKHVRSKSYLVNDIVTLLLATCICLVSSPEQLQRDVTSGSGSHVL